MQRKKDQMFNWEKKKKLNIIAIKGEMTTWSNRWFTAKIRSNHHSRVMEGPSKLV